jgi:hypothetical protein
MQHALLEIDVLPLQAEQLAEPQPGEQRGAEERWVVVAGCRLPRELLCGLDQRGDLLVRPDMILPALAPMWPIVAGEQREGVDRDQPAAESEGHRAVERPQVAVDHRRRQWLARGPSRSNSLISLAMCSGVMAVSRIWPNRGISTRSSAAR